MPLKTLLPREWTVNDMRLIDADALEKYITEKFEEHYGKTVYQFIRDFFRFVVRQIRKAPTIDAVPVCRCKDCKHFLEKGGILEPWCDRHEARLFCGHGFCSDGERKDGDT